MQEGRSVKVRNGNGGSRKGPAEPGRAAKAQRKDGNGKGKGNGNGMDQMD
jgi:hypothetical protein